MVHLIRYKAAKSGPMINSGPQIFFEKETCSLIVGSWLLKPERDKEILLVILTKQAVSCAQCSHKLMCVLIELNSDIWAKNLPPKGLGNYFSSNFDANIHMDSSRTTS